MSTAIVMIAAVMGGDARAATITYSGPAPDIFNNGGYSAFSWQQFDPAAGLLNGVTYRVAGEFTFSLSQTAPFSIQPTYNVSKGLTLNGTGLAWKDPFSAPFDAIINLGRPAGDPLTPAETESRTVLVNFLRSPNLGLAAFIGTGLIDANLRISEDSDLCYSDELAGSAHHVDCSQTGHLTVSVTYDYTPRNSVPPNDAPVPEPASALLLGLGLATAGVSAARRTVRGSVPRP